MPEETQENTDTQLNGNRKTKCGMNEEFTRGRGRNPGNHQTEILELNSVKTNNQPQITVESLNGLDQALERKSILPNMIYRLNTIPPSKY